MIHNKLLLTLIVIVSCTSGIKNELDFSIGKEQEYHDAIFGEPVTVGENEKGKTNYYEINGKKCKYEVYIDKDNIVRGYKILSDYSECRLPINWGGPW